MSLTEVRNGGPHWAINFFWRSRGRYVVLTSCMCICVDDYFKVVTIFFFMFRVVLVILINTIESRRDLLRLYMRSHVVHTI